MPIISRIRLPAALVLALGLALMLNGCVAPPPEPPATSEPAQTNSPPTVAPVNLATGTPQAQATLRPQATLVANIPIDVIGATTQTTITPRHIVRVLTTDSPLQILVHYPGSVGDGNPTVDFTEPSTVRWSIAPLPAPDPNTVAFTLSGADPGIFTLQITAAGYAPVRFGVRAALPPSPVGAGGTVESTPAAQTGATPIVVTAVPSTGGPLGGGTPTPGAILASPQTVTLADAGATIALHPGDRFLLALGEGYDWTVTIGDPAIVSRVPNILPVRGAQGVYEAHTAGQTTLTATGDPACRKAQPPCMMPSRQFQVQIIVQ
jgi:hypothetical protein